VSVPDSAACSSVGIFEGEYMLWMSDDEMCLRKKDKKDCGVGLVTDGLLV
jgi:hypothetical protein